MGSYNLCPRSPYKYPLNFTIPYTIKSHSPPLSSSFFCNNVYPSFLFGNSGIVWTVNGDDNELERSLVCLGVMLIFLDARLTIKVFFALEKKHTLHKSPSPSPSISPNFTLHILLYPITSIFFWSRCSFTPFPLP